MQMTTTSSRGATVAPGVQGTAEHLLDELELIGYVTSHDLQAPLRVIQSSCEELNRQPELAGQRTMKTITAEAARMKALMQGVVEYIRLDTFPTASAPLDMNELFAAAKAALGEEIRLSGATITCDDLPHIMGHRGRITRLLAFLLDNAMKFHNSKFCTVKVSAERDGAMWRFCIADNGIGIDPEYHAIIFQLFQRLHTAEGYPGHGIGLSLARKIADAHGGKLWLESALGQGSRFYFTLPAAE